VHIPLVLPIPNGYRVWSIAGFPHMLYKLWLVGVAARHLEVFL